MEKEGPRKKKRGRRKKGWKRCPPFSFPLVVSCEKKKGRGGEALSKKRGRGDAGMSDRGLLLLLNRRSGRGYKKGEKKERGRGGPSKKGKKKVARFALVAHRCICGSRRDGAERERGKKGGKRSERSLPFLFSG